MVSLVKQKSSAQRVVAQSRNVARLDDIDIVDKSDLYQPQPIDFHAKQKFIMKKSDNLYEVKPVLDEIFGKLLRSDDKGDVPALSNKIASDDEGDQFKQDDRNAGDKAETDLHEQFENALIHAHQLASELSSLVTWSQINIEDKARYELYRLANKTAGVEHDYNKLDRQELSSLNSSRIKQLLVDFEYYLDLLHYSSICVPVTSINPKHLQEESMLAKIDSYPTKERQSNSRFTSFRKNLPEYLPSLENLPKSQKHLNEILDQMLNRRQRSNEIKITIHDILKKEKNKLQNIKHKAALQSFVFTHAVKNCQILVSLDYFLNNIELLVEENFQIYFMLNIFSPNLLLEQIERNSHTSVLLTELIYLGIQRFFDCIKLKPEGLFFLELAFYAQRIFEQVKQKMLPNDRLLNESIQKLSALDQDILQWIDLNNSKQDDVAKSRIKELYQIYLLRLDLKLKNTGGLSDANIIHLVTANFMINLIPGLHKLEQE